MTSRTTVIIGVGGAVLLVVGIFLAVYIPLSHSSASSKGFAVIPDNVIRYKKGDATSSQPYVEKLKNFIKSYEGITPDDTYIKCSDTLRPKGDEVCIVDPTRLQVCMSSDDFGYNTSHPCVFLAVHLDETFEPEPYENINDLPDDIPQDLRTEMGFEVTEDGKLKQGVWADCSNNVLVLEPSALIPIYYFDNTGAEKYLAPFIAIQFDLAKKKNQDVEVECTLWAKNIDHTRDDFSKLSITLHYEEV